MPMEQISMKQMFVKQFFVLEQVSMKQVYVKQFFDLKQISMKQVFVEETFVKNIYGTCFCQASDCNMKISKQMFIEQFKNQTNFQIHFCLFF